MNEIVIYLWNLLRGVFGNTQAVLPFIAPTPDSEHTVRIGHKKFYAVRVNVINREQLQSLVSDLMRKNKEIYLVYKTKEMRAPNGTPMTVIDSLVVLADEETANTLLDMGHKLDNVTPLFPKVSESIEVI